MAQNPHAAAIVHRHIQDSEGWVDTTPIWQMASSHRKRRRSISESLLWNKHRMKPWRKEWVVVDDQDFDASSNRSIVYSMDSKRRALIEIST